MATENAAKEQSGASTIKINRSGRYKLIVKRYRRNKLAMVGMVVFLALLIAVFAAPLYID